MGKQARSRVTYARILDAAATEFARHGYANASLQEIALRTGLTKGALYGHFASKEQLAETLVRRLDVKPPDPQPTADPLNASALGQLRDLTCDFATRIETDIQVNAAVRLAVDAAQKPDARSESLHHIAGRALELADRAEDN
ncbi:TetR family transcriptional regulator [Streptomyces sp. NBC_00147]|uniref:TetR family transcriptional regulator n=1 Tax=Streptomyces sp. NBC_00147 TaxID=2975667 RepID=UPI00324EFD3F